MLRRYSANTFEFHSFISSPALFCPITAVYCSPAWLCPRWSPRQHRPNNPGAPSLSRLIFCSHDCVPGLRAGSVLAASLRCWMWVMPTDMSCCHRDDSLSITVRNITASLPRRQSAEGWPCSQPPEWFASELYISPHWIFIVLVNTTCELCHPGEWRHSNVDLFHFSSYINSIVRAHTT